MYLLITITMYVSTLEEVAIATECCSAITMDTLPSIITITQFVLFLPSVEVSLYTAQTMVIAFPPHFKFVMILVM